MCRQHVKDVLVIDEECVEREKECVVSRCMKNELFLKRKGLLSVNEDLLSAGEEYVVNRSNRIC